MRTAGKSFEQLAAELGRTYNGSDALWYTPAETAALIRAKLKQAFPGATFKVQTDTYSGGASIRVYAPAGIDATEVERVAGAFSAADFDGMTDSTVYRKNELEVGGTKRRVHYGAHYIFCYDAAERLASRG